MALLLMDGFDAADNALRYTSMGGNTVTTTITRFSTGRAVNLSAINLGISGRISASATVYAGFAIYMTNNASGGPIITFYGDNGSVMHGGIRVVNTSIWGIYRAGTQLATFAAPAGTTWVYVEVSCTIHDSTGNITVRINGAQVATYTGDTRNGGTGTNIDRFVLGYTGGTDWVGGLPYMDDLYISDSSFLGDVRVQTLVPTAAGTSTQFTPTGGANYANVADIPDSAATYNTSSTVGHLDTYTLGDLVPGTGTVYGVQTTMHAMKTDAGQGAVKDAIRSGGTVYYGNTTQLSSSTAWIGQIRETDPATSAAWTASGVNALEGGVEVA